MLKRTTEIQPRGWDVLRNECFVYQNKITVSSEGTKIKKKVEIM